MSEFTGKVQALGRIAIPKDLREANGIEEGDLVVVTVKKVINA